MKTRHEIGDGRLAGAASPDQRHHRSGRHLHGEIAHHRPPLPVFELDVIELDLPDDPRRFAGVGFVGLVGFHRQDFEHPLHRRERALQL